MLSRNNPSLRYKMATEYTINGVRARMHEASGTKITEDGMYVEKEYMENGILKKFNPKVEIGNNGLRRIYNKKLGYYLVYFFYILQYSNI